MSNLRYTDSETVNFSGEGTEANPLTGDTIGRPIVNMSCSDGALCLETIDEVLAIRPSIVERSATLDPDTFTFDVNTPLGPIAGSEMTVQATLGDKVPTSVIAKLTTSYRRTNNEVSSGNEVWANVQPEYSLDGGVTWTLFDTGGSNQLSGDVGRDVEIEFFDDRTIGTQTGTIDIMTRVNLVQNSLDALTVFENFRFSLKINYMEMRCVSTPV